MKWSIGPRHNIYVRQEQVRGLPRANLRLLYVSDLHFSGQSAHAAAQIMDNARLCRPDILLLGGDYVDWPGGWPHFRHLLADLVQICPVLAISGNHDRFWGLTDLKKMMLAYGVIWIDTTSVYLDIGGQRIQIDGRICANQILGADYHILCLHEPHDIDAAKYGYDLIVAGHLHGCQLVIRERPSGLFPGRWCYRWNILRADFGSYAYIVSRGAGDTLKIRYNCSHEVLLIQL